MSALPRQHWTVESYLAFERDSEERHEFLDGEVILMVGASANHNLIVANTLASLHAQLRKRPCLIYPSDMRVSVRPAGLYTYPDISIVCGAPELEDDHHDTLLNPTLLIEVLSPSTESYDRGKKFRLYRALESLQEYVLITQDEYRVERYLRQPGETWLLTDASGLEATLELTSVACHLALADVYEKVTLGDATDQ